MDTIGIGLIIVIIAAILYMAYTKKRENRLTAKNYMNTAELKIKEPRTRTEKIYKSSVGKKKSSKRKPSKKTKTKKATKKKPGKHKCSKCGRTFSSKRGLSIHQTKSH